MSQSESASSFTQHIAGVLESLQCMQVGKTVTEEPNLPYLIGLATAMLFQKGELKKNKKN